MDQYADDLAELIEQLDLKNLILVGHSTGGGAVTRYMGRHGTKRVAKAVLLGAVPPLMVKTEKNPGGLSVEVFDAIRTGAFDNRSQFFKDLSMAFLTAADTLAVQILLRRGDGGMKRNSTEGVLRRRSQRACSCGRYYDNEAWAALRLITRLTAHDVAAIVTSWPVDLVVEVRVCASCSRQSCRLVERNEPIAA